MQSEKIKIGAFCITLMVLNLNCASEEIESIQQKKINLEDPQNIAFSHPLLNVDLINGEVPGVDIHHINGNKIAIGEDTNEIEYGSVIHSSGIIELNSEYIVQQEPDEYQGPNIFDVIHPSLQHAMSEADENELIPVRIGIIGGETEEHLFITEERMIGLGQITDYDSKEQGRIDILNNKNNNIINSAQNIVNYLNGINVDFKLRKNMYLISSMINKSHIQYLESHPDVKSLSLYHIGSNDTSSGDLDLSNTLFDNWVDGAELAQGTQNSQFILSNFDGRFNWTNRIKAAQIESVTPRKTHLVYRTNNSSSWSRITNSYECGFFSCSSINQSDRHATRVAQLINADLHDGQDPNVTTINARYKTKGMSPESSLISYGLGTGVLNYFSFDEAVEEIIDMSKPPHVVNMSHSILDYEDLFYTCNGLLDEDEIANDLFENGILLIKSAGNPGNEDPGVGINACSIGVPGSAASTFTVNGHGNISSAAGALGNVQNGNPSNNAVRSNVDRKTVDLTASKFSASWISHNSDNAYFINNFTAGGTSYSTPIVTGSALNFIDFYRRTFSNYIDNPGVLFSNLLMMGDRDSGSFDSQHDRVMGAGRIKMRMYNHTGMDYPWRYMRYSFCVDHGEVIRVHFGPNGPQSGKVFNQIPNDVEHFKAVIYWYDRRLEDHGKYQKIDKINMRVGSNLTPLNSYSFGLSSYNHGSSEADNKEMVYLNLDGSTGAQMKENGITLEIIGANVTSDNEGCGNNSNKVWLTLMYEDGDRDDADGPSTMIATP